MTRIALTVRALYQGAQLAKVETWKKTGVATTTVTGVLSALAGIAVSMGWIGDVNPQLIIEISSALVAIVSVFLGYVQVATTEKIGLRPTDHQPVSLSEPVNVSNKTDAHGGAFGPWGDHR